MGWRLWLRGRSWNNDPNSVELAGLLGEAAMDAASGTGSAKKENEMLKLLIRADWRKAEAGDRIIHALSLVKLAFGSSDEYRHAKDIAERFYINIGKW